MSIVERGVWDDFFPLEGGGHVHMKLQFTLNDDERNRIRSVRESALKKKQAELLNSGAIGQEIANIDGSRAALSPRQNDERESVLKKKQAELLNSGVTRKETANFVGSTASLSPHHNEERESALKKKQAELLNSGVVSQETTNIDGSKAALSPRHNDERESLVKKKQAELLNSSVTRQETANVDGSTAALSPRHNDERESVLKKKQAELLNSGVTRKETTNFDGTTAALSPRHNDERGSALRKEQVELLNSGAISQETANVDGSTVALSPRHNDEKESALKKKQAEVLNSSAICQETANIDGSTAALSPHHNDEVSGSEKSTTFSEASDQRKLLSLPVSFSDDQISDAGKKEEEPKNTNDADRSEESSSSTISVSQVEELPKDLLGDSKRSRAADGTTTSPTFPQETASALGSSESAVAEKNNSSVSMKLDDGLAIEPKQQQGPFKKSLSNVMKMATAFESSSLQDTRPLIKGPAVKRQLNRIGTDGLVKDQNLKNVSDLPKPSADKLKNPFLTGELQQIQTSVRKKNEHDGFDTDSGLKDTPKHSKESRIVQIQPKELNSNAMNKLKLFGDGDRQEQTQISGSFVGIPNVETAILIEAAAEKPRSNRVVIEHVLKDQKIKNVDDSLKLSPAVLKNPPSLTEEFQQIQTNIGKTNEQDGSDPDTKDLSEAEAVKLPSNRVVIEHVLKDQNIKTFDDSAKLSPNMLKNRSLTRGFQQIQTNIKKTNEEHDEFDADLGCKDMTKHTKEPSTKAAAVKPQPNRVVIESVSKDQNLKNLDNLPKPSPNKLKNPSLTGKFQQIQTNIGKSNEHDGFDPDSGFKDMTKHTKDSSIKAAAVKPQTNRVVIERVLTDQNLKNVDDSGKLSPKRLNQQIQTNIGKTNEHDGLDPDSGRTDMTKHSKESSMMPDELNSDARSKLKMLRTVNRQEQRQPPEILMQTSDVETATVSGKMSNEHSSRDQTRDLPTENWTRATSYDKRKSAAYYQGGDNTADTSRAWIFADDSIHLCITTTSKEVMDLTEGCNVDAHQREMNVSATENVWEHNVEGEADVEMIREEKISRKQRKPRPESPEDVASAGFGGQAIKIAIMVGFGALVLFTGQRKPRKSNTEVNQPFLRIAGFLDQEQSSEELKDSRQRMMYNLSLS